MSVNPQDPRVSTRRLIWIGPLTVVASIVAVLVVRDIAVAILHPASAFVPLQLLPPILDTAVLVSWAVLIFAAIVRFLLNPILKFKAIALVLLLLSFVPDIALAKRRWFGGTFADAVALMTMHMTAWAVAVSILTGLGSTHRLRSATRRVGRKHVGYFVFSAILVTILISPVVPVRKIALIAIVTIVTMYGVLLQRLRHRRVGSAAVGSFYDMLEQDKRRAVEIVVDQRAEEQAPEDAEGGGPDVK